MLHIILLLLPGVVSDDWNVIYPPLICAARGSNVTINCSFKYPHGYKVQRVQWCSARSVKEECKKEPSVYDSDNDIQNNFQYIGDKTSNCSLLISNISKKHSGTYKFRFITNKPDGLWTGQYGANVSVHDLRVSMSRSRENGSTIAGDSVNLTCTINCSGDVAEVQWFKNGDLIQQSEPFLTFTRITAQDSGKYSCSLRNFKTTVSEEFTIYIEEDLQKITGSSTVLIIVVSLVSLVFITAAVLLIRRKKAKPQRKPTEEREEAQDPLYSTPQKTAHANPPDLHVQQEDEVEYSSFCIKPKEMSANTEQEHDSTIYSAVMNG